MEMQSDFSDANATQDFSRANIVSQCNKIRLVDSDEETGLDLFCYVSCSNDEDEFVKQSRGLVFHGDNLIMKAFSYTDEYSHENTGKINTVLSEFSNWSFYTAYEGALLRMFYFADRWFLSTHRKLNAFRSKWASRESFGELFVKALQNEVFVNKDFANLLDSKLDNVLENFQSTLDKDKQYMFLLRNSSDNRIVCDAPETKESYILHVGTFVDGKLHMDVNCGLGHPTKYNFKNVEELTEFVNQSINPKKLQGVMCIHNSEKQVKILHSDYHQLFQARGNEPSINFRYLQVRMNKKMTDMMYHLYPERTKQFDDYENIIYDISRTIYRAYVQRFIKKNHVTVPREEYKVITQCHSWHLADRENNRISLDKVISVLNKQTPTNINHMIRRYKLEQIKKQLTVPRAVPGSRNNSAVNSPAFIPIETTKRLSQLSLNQ